MRVCVNYMHMRGARSYLSIYTHVHVLCMWGTYTKVCLHGALALGLTFDPEWKGQESPGRLGRLRSPLSYQGLPLAYLGGLLASPPPLYICEIEEAQRVESCHAPPASEKQNWG